MSEPFDPARHRQVMARLASTDVTPQPTGNGVTEADLHSWVPEADPDHGDYAWRPLSRPEPSAYPTGVPAPQSVAPVSINAGPSELASGSSHSNLPGNSQPMRTGTPVQPAAQGGHHHPTPHKPVDLNAEIEKMLMEVQKQRQAYAAAPATVQSAPDAVDMGGLAAAYQQSAKPRLY